MSELDHATQKIALAEVLDRVLHKGVVVNGEVLVSVAGVDLIYLGLQLVLTSAETGRRIFEPLLVERQMATKEGSHAGG